MLHRIIQQWSPLLKEASSQNRKRFVLPVMYEYHIIISYIIALLYKYELQHTSNYVSRFQVQAKLNYSDIGPHIRTTAKAPPTSDTNVEYSLLVHDQHKVPAGMHDYLLWTSTEILTLWQA